jgi:DNA topoisomerase-1
MPKSLVIVESSAKSKTINRFLGKNFVVKASVGHIKNLPKNRLGVNVDDRFEPEYITIRGRGKILKELKRQAGAVENVYIATDPDREGEAIAQHLYEEIRGTNPNIQRVLFHEITENGIRDAIQQPKNIDLSLVEAQKARRVMDRLVGYQVSPFLWQTIYRGLSAGRVQTVALRLICEREAEIAGFTTQEYWTIEAELSTKADEKFLSRLVKINGEDATIPNEASAQSHLDALKGLEYVVSDLKSKEIKRNPMPPYTTSTLQQEAARRLNMTTKQIMAVAQQLYEGVDLPEGRVGLITYMRTDSVRLAPSAVAEARQFIAENYGLEYVPPKPLTYKNKKSAQDAHEAIRPASLSHPLNQVAAHLTPGQKKLYELIWNRFIASQMSPAQIRQTTLEVTAGKYLFRTTGSVVLFKGFMQIYEMDKEEDAASVPKGVGIKDPVDLVRLDPGQHFTKPPARFTESSLVKELDNLGIGRPSTYALIITTLLDRTYVDRESRSLKPTELGVTVYRILIDQFPELFNVHFTAKMEDELDQIESVTRNGYRPCRIFTVRSANPSGARWTRKTKSGNRFRTRPKTSVPNAANRW